MTNSRVAKATTPTTGKRAQAATALTTTTTTTAAMTIIKIVCSWQALSRTISNGTETVTTWSYRSKTRVKRSPSTTTSADAYQLDRIEAGDSHLLNAGLNRLVQAMAVFDVPDGAGSVVIDEVKQQLEPLLTEVWQTV